MDAIRRSHFDLAERWLLCEGSPELMFTDNQSNFERLFGVPNHGPYVKDTFNEYVVNGKKTAVNQQTGTKVAAHYRLPLEGSRARTIECGFLPLLARTLSTVNSTSSLETFPRNLRVLQCRRSRGPERR